MTPEAASLLNDDLERSRFDDLPTLRRRLVQVIRWWLARGRGLDEFFTLFGYVAGLTYRNAFGTGFLAWLVVRGLAMMRRGVSMRAGVDHPGWLQSAMVAWFVTGQPDFAETLYRVGSTPVTQESGSGRIWQARYIVNSVRVRNPDFADQISELEAAGGPLVPIGEMPAPHGAA